MVDIFISYASEDVERAEPIAEALDKQGWTVWWDRTIPPGKVFDEEIEKAISSAKCVVVLWSDASIKSNWVKEEATIGRDREILIPAEIDPVNRPLGFRRIQAADLTDWTGESTHGEFVNFMKAISEIINPPNLKKETEVFESQSIEPPERLYLVNRKSVPDYDQSKMRRKIFKHNRKKNVFIIMNYKGEKVLNETEDRIKGALIHYGLRGFSAKEVMFGTTVWDNMKFCMDNSEYAVAVYGNIGADRLSQDTSMEHGYMLAKNAEILILKQKGTKLPGNMEGRLIRDFMPNKLEDSIEKHIAEWLSGLNYPYALVPKTEIIINPKALANRIIQESNGLLNKTKYASEKPLVRHAAILSSLAISDIEKTEDAEILKLLIDQRNRFETMISEGFIVRLIICPEMYTMLVENKIRCPKEAENKILPRFDQLISVLDKNMETPNLQVVCAPLIGRLFLMGGDSLVILDNEKMFHAKKRTSKSGFRYTSLIYDAEQIKSQISIFDKSFREWAYPITTDRLYSGRIDEEHPRLLDGKLGSKNLKYEVIEKLKKERNNIGNLLRYESEG